MRNVTTFATKLLTAIQFTYQETGSGSKNRAVQEKQGSKVMWGYTDLEVLMDEKGISAQM